MHGVAARWVGLGECLFYVLGTPPLTDKALEAALKAADPLLFSADDATAHMAASPVRVDVAKDMVRSRIKAAISAYLSALPGEAEVVAWKHKLTSIIRYDRPNSYDLAQGDYEPLVTLAPLQAMQARAEKAERERDEAVDWTATVERHGANGFDDLAEAWLALPAIQRTTNAAISTFSKWANEDLMARFKKNQLAMFHLAFVEGCLAGVRTESVLSKTAEARVKDAVGLLDHLIDWIVHDCGAEPPFTSEQDETYTALKGGSNG